MRYAAIIEWDEDRYSGHIPDLPGVFADGDSPEAVAGRLEQGAVAYLEVLRQQQRPIPEPKVQVRVIEAA